MEDYKDIQFKNCLSNAKKLFNNIDDETIFRKGFTNGYATGKTVLKAELLTAYEDFLKEEEVENYERRITQFDNFLSKL